MTRRNKLCCVCAANGRQQETKKGSTASEMRTSAFCTRLANFVCAIMPYYSPFRIRTTINYAVCVHPLSAHAAGKVASAGEGAKKRRSSEKIIIRKLVHDFRWAPGLTTDWSSTPSSFRCWRWPIFRACAKNTKDNCRTINKRKVFRARTPIKSLSLRF